jgi:membrane-bound serine protease (ClpP class)
VITRATYAAIMADVAATALAGGRRPLPRGLLAVAGAALVLLGLLGAPGPSAALDDQAGEPGGPVYLVDISGTIDLGLAPYLARVLEEARDAGAAAVVVEIDTPGGRLDAVLQMRDELLDSPLRTVAFIDSSAFSAGALVALASEEIYMTPRAVMGAATPVLGGTGEVADDKTVSAVRSTFEATAEQRGRDPEVAAAMVDASIEVEGVSDAGSLLTLTASLAVEVGYADGLVPDRAALLAELGLEDRELVGTAPSLAEQLVRFVTHPIVASLLLLVGLLALLGDLASGGVGLGAALGAGLLALFFWGHMLAGLAGWEDAALVVLGLVLIAVEVFLVPGFGVPGILGLLALLAGAFMAMINRDFDFVTDADLLRAGITVTVALVGTMVGLVVVLTMLARGGARSGLVLQARLGSGEPVTQRTQSGWLRWFGTASGSIPHEPEADRGPPSSAGTEPAGAAPAAATGTAGSLVGARGTALSDLRPSGVADIDGERVDVVTTGDYLGSGEPVEVVIDEGYRRVVRRPQE